MIKDKKKSKLRDYPDGVKSNKWRNLYFFKDGSLLTGQKLFDSEVSALNKATSCISVAMDTLSWFGESEMTCAVTGKRSGKMWSNFSHAIQMPVKG